MKDKYKMPEYVTDTLNWKFSLCETMLCAMVLVEQNIEQNITAENVIVLYFHT